MTAPRRWLRLDVTWSASEWVSALRPGGRLAWVELLSYVKAYGMGGRSKGLTAHAAGRRWSIPTKDVSEMINAAINDRALTIEENGDWVVVNFGRYQEVDTTAAERMRKHRTLRRNGGNEGNGNGGRAPSVGTSRRNSRNVRGVPSRDRDVDSDSDSDRTAGEHARAGSPSALTPNVDGYTPTDDQRTRAAELHVELDRALRLWRAHRKSNGLTPIDLAADFDGWLEREPGYANGNGAPTEPAAHGIVKRFDPVPADDEPPPDPELRKAGFDLVRQAVNGVRSPAESDAEISDPEVIAKREARKAQLKAQAAALAGPGGRA